MDVGNGYKSIATSIHHYVPGPPSELSEVKLTEYDLGNKLLSTLELDEFYSLLAHSKISFPRFSSSTPGTIILPSIYNPHWDRAHSKPNDCHAIPTKKHLTLDDLYIGSWYNIYTSDLCAIPTTNILTPDDLYTGWWYNVYTGDLPQEVLPTGWTQCAYGCFVPSFSNNCSVGLIIQSVTHVGSGST
jgi:hypothetical protein